MLNNRVKKKYLLKAKIACFVLQLAPFIRMVGLTGSLARDEVTINSDIDFMIITRAGRIWTCRAFCLVLMVIFGLKRYKDKISGRVCMNIFQTDDHLKLSYLDHRESPEWLARDYAHMVPLWQKGQIFTEFMKENNWIKKYGQSFVRDNYQPSTVEVILSLIITLARVMTEFVYDIFFNGWMENLLKQYQAKRINSDLRTQKAKDGEIFVSDYELRFHPSKE